MNVSDKLTFGKYKGYIAANVALCDRPYCNFLIKRYHELLAYQESVLRAERQPTDEEIEEIARNQRFFNTVGNFVKLLLSEEKLGYKSDDDPAKDAEATDGSA